MPVEVVYDYVKKQHQLSREAFAALFEAPALLFKRVSTDTSDHERTRTDMRILPSITTMRFLDDFALRLTDEAHVLRLFRLPKNGTVSIGRTSINDLVLLSGEVSKQHARIVCDNGHVLVTDLDSSNGVFVDDRPIAKNGSVQLHPGQTLRIASVPLRVLTGNELYRELELLTTRTTASP